MYSEKISNFIDEKKSNMINDIIEIVKIPSISSDLVEVKKALHYILDLATEMGFESRAVLDDQVGIIEIGEEEEIIGILAHVDVVPSGDIDAWVVPPFKPEVKDGAIWGRGTVDDKGPIISCLYAIKAVESLGKPFKKKIQLIIGTQEEVEWTDMKAYVKEFPLPDYGFTPDGEFPVCNIEKGMANIEISVPVDTKLEGELVIKSINGGRAFNIVPDEVIVELDCYGKPVVLKAAGVSTHSCFPDKGDNAIVNMSNVLEKLPIKSNGFDKVIKMICKKLADVYCSGVGLYSEDEYYNGEFVHRNTMSPTLISTENNKVRVNINFRHAYGTEEQDIRSAFERVAEEFGGEITQIEFMPAIYVNKDKPFMKAFANAYEKITGLKHEFALEYGGSYAKAMPNIVCWGPLFPGDEDTTHEVNERLDIGNLMLMTKIYGEALSKIVLSEESFK